MGFYQCFNLLHLLKGSEPGATVPCVEESLGILRARHLCDGAPVGAGGGRDHGVHLMGPPVIAADCGIQAVSPDTSLAGFSQASFLAHHPFLSLRCS